MDPDFIMTGKLTRKTDVFAFGVVLFELVSGRHVAFDEEDVSLARWAQNCVKKRDFGKIVESEIKGEPSPKSLKEFAQIAFRCLHSDPKKRPTMSEVVIALELSESLQEKFNRSARLAGVQSGVQNLKVFSFADLKYATRNFYNPTRSPSRRWVSKGWVDKETYSPSKLEVGLAISVSNLRSSTWLNLQILDEFSHPNLVKLLGYCLENRELYLVHEFMGNRSLKDYLHKGEPSFPKRVKIAVGVARGLAFLHSKQLITRKWILETHDIQLDKDFNVKLKGFDAAKLIYGLDKIDQFTCDSNAAGSWWQQLRLCDVNGLGMLLMEILTGQPVPGKRKMEFMERQHLCSERSNKLIEDVMDPQVKLNAPEFERARELLSLIFKCTRYQGYTIEKALEELEQIYSRVTECKGVASPRS